MLWSGVVSAFQKALGQKVTPRVWIESSDGRKELDFTTIRLDKRGFSLNLKE